MSECLLALYSLLMLLMLSLSFCHTVVKRKAPDGQLYVFSKTEGCVAVQSEEPCPLSWKLNPLLAKVYKQESSVITNVINIYEIFGYNSKCIQAVKRTLCSQITPRCSADGSKDYGDVSALSQFIYDSCPQQLQKALEKNKFFEKFKKGKQPKSQCVALSTPVGVCPQPKFKMPEELIAGYREKSKKLVPIFDTLRNLKYNNGERAFSSKCLSQLKEAYCSPVYCSADENLLLTKHDQNDCNYIIKECFDDVLSKLSSQSSVYSELSALRKSLQLNCDTLPVASSAQLQAEPPTVPPSGASTFNFGHSILLLAVSFLMKIYI